MKIMILTAALQEAASFIEYLSNTKPLSIAKRNYLYGTAHGHELYLANTGVGAIAAANTTTALCESLQPELIFICGAAGGLVARQCIGDFLIGETIFDLDHYDLPEIFSDTPFADWLIDPHSQQSVEYAFTAPEEFLARCLQTGMARVRKGIIASSSIFPTPKNKLAQLKALHCDVIEMESAAVYHAAAHYAIPVIAIRAISNHLDAAGNDLGTSSDAITICANRIAALLNDCLINIA